MLRLKTLLLYRYTSFIILIIVLCLTLIRNYLPKTSIISINETTFQGVLLDKEINGDKLSFIIKDKEKIKCTYYIKSKEEKDMLENLIIGQELSIKGNLTIPSNNTIPNIFNYQEYLANNEIYYLLNVDELTISNKDISLLYKIKHLLDKYISKYQSKGYLYTFITGNKDNLEEGVYEQYQELGVSHIFAISGMHVSILASIIFKLLYKLKDNYKYYIIIAFLLFYLTITNYAASILRSVSLYIYLFLNKRLSLNLETINVYYLAIAILLLFMPNLITNIGFQYSAITSYALIKYNKLIKGNYISKCLIISLIAFLFSLPISIINNFEINILSILNNLIFVPLITFIIYPLSLLCLCFPFIDNIYFNLMQIVELISNKLLVFNIIIPDINGFIIGIYYLLISLFLNTFDRKYLLITILLLTIIKIYPYLDSNYYVYYLDVGQGDSVLIKHQDEAILIDTGGVITYSKEEWQEREPFHISSNMISFFKSIGVDDIDYLLITHGDYDHMGEAINLVENFKVEKVIFNCGEFNDLEQDLIKVLNKKKISYYSCIKELNIDGNKVYFMNDGNYDNENDNSNVIYTELNNYKFLFMGDAGGEVEEDILEKYNLKDIDVLKVGHHGSKTSTGKMFIDSINPKYSIISVGKNNRYGHPNDNVLGNLADSKIYRTDQDGSVVFNINKDKLNIETCVP